MSKPRAGRPVLIAVLGSAVLMAATVAPALAKGPPTTPPGSTFSVSICADGDDLRFNVIWSRISADRVAVGIGDGTGQGLGASEPLDGVARSGSTTMTLTGVVALAEVAGASLHLKQAVMASHTETRPATGWPAC